MQDRPRRRLWLRIAAWLTTSILVLGVSFWFLGMPLEAWYWGKRMPALRERPIPIRDSSITRSAGRKLSFCGCEFEVPWNDLDETKTKTGPNSAALHFESGLVALLKCQPPREFVEGVLSSTQTPPEAFRRAFGDRAFQSDYYFTRLMLETTPDEITPRMAHGQDMSIMAMLVLKMMAMPRSDTGLFSIHTAEFDGFQYQDPQKRPDWLLVDLFAADRGLEMQFFLNYHDASPHVSQADINRVISTLHKVGPYTTVKQAVLAP